MITNGDYVDLFPEHPQVFGYRRQTSTQTLICLNNYYATEAEVELDPHLNLNKGKFILNNYMASEQQVLTHHQELKAYETKVILIEH